MGNEMNVTGRKASGETQQETLPDTNGNGFVDPEDTDALMKVGRLLDTYESLTTEKDQVIDSKAFIALTLGDAVEPSSKTEPVVEPAAATTPEAVTANKAVTPKPSQKESDSSFSKRSVGTRVGIGFGVGEYGHSGPKVEVFAEQLLGSAKKLALFVQGTFDAQSGNMNYSSPGGEAGFKSHFRNFGGGVNLVGRAALTDNVNVELGAGASYMSLKTPASTYETRPTGTCPADVPPVECEPSANGGRSDTGATGLIRTDLRSSTGAQGGSAVGLRAFAGINLQIFGSGSVGLFVQADRLNLRPEHGTPVDVKQVTGGVSLSWTLGSKGAAIKKNEITTASRPDVGVPTVAEYPAGEALTLTNDDAVRAFGGLDGNATILGVQFDGLEEDTTAPYEVPAASMTTGDHEVKIRYRNPGDTEDKIKVIKIKVGETPDAAAMVTGLDEVTPTKVIAGMSQEFTSFIWRSTSGKVSRPAAESGVEAKPIYIASIDQLSNLAGERMPLPEGSYAEVRVSDAITGTMGSPTKIDLALTEATSITIPRDTANGPHTVSVLVVIPGREKEVIIQTVDVQPDTAFKTDPKIVPATSSNRRMDKPKLILDTTQALDGVTITVNGEALYGFTGHLNPGLNTLAITKTNIGAGTRRNHFTNNTRGVVAGSYDVVITLPNGETKTVPLVIEGAVRRRGTTTTTGAGGPPTLGRPRHP